MTVFEDKLRERPTLNVLQERGTARIVELTAAERDALADAVEALRAIADGNYKTRVVGEPQPTVIDRKAAEIVYAVRLTAGEIARDALARLDAA